MRAASSNLSLAAAVTLFERRRDAWLNENLAAYLALWAGDMTFQSPVHVQPVCGRAAFGELVRQSFAVARPLQFTFAHIAVTGPIVLAEWEIAIEQRNSGARIAWHGMSAAEIRDDLIVAWREYWNPAALFAGA